MTDVFEISALRPDEVEQACKLFQCVFGAVITPAHWHWKYSLGPRLGGINLVARSTSGQLLAHCGASIFQGICATQTIAMAQLCDVMVERESRGGYSVNTIYPQLLRAMEAELLQRYSTPFAYGFVGPRPFKLGKRLDHYRAIQPYRTIYTVPEDTRGWKDLAWTVCSSPWNIQLLDKIWNLRSAHLRSPIVARTGAYLAWRYRDHPVHTYQLWFIKHLCINRGWFVTRIMPDGGMCVIDALLPNAISASKLVAALYQQNAKLTGSIAPIASWIGQTDPAHTSDSNVSVEFKLQAWHPEQPDPKFQPGDTDVY